MKPLVRKYRTAEALLHLLKTDFPDSLEVQLELETYKLEFNNIEPGLDAFIEYARLRLQVQVNPSDSDD